MNLRIDNHIHSLQDRADRLDSRPTSLRTAPSSTQAGGGSQDAIAAISNQNRVAANPIASASAARHIGALLRTQISAQPTTAFAAQQISLRSVQSLLN